MSSTSPHAAGVGAVFGPAQSRSFPQSVRVQSRCRIKLVPPGEQHGAPPSPYQHDHTRRYATTERGETP